MLVEIVGGKMSLNIQIRARAFRVLLAFSVASGALVSVSASLFEFYRNSSKLYSKLVGGQPRELDLPSKIKQLKA
jgi:hypothetical protein